MKELTISANVSADTLARPTTVGSRFMHFSQARQAFSMAGTRVLGAHRFSKYSLEQTAISCNISKLVERHGFVTSRVFFYFLIHISLDGSDECPHNVQRDSDEKHVENQLEISRCHIREIGVRSPSGGFLIVVAIVIESEDICLKTLRRIILAFSIISR
jgi:hypothetical protein